MKSGHEALDHTKALASLISSSDISSSPTPPPTKKQKKTKKKDDEVRLDEERSDSILSPSLHLTNLSAPASLLAPSRAP